MIELPHTPRSHCPINFGLEIFGDRWSLLVLRDLLLAGKSSFKQFQESEEGISSNILSDRLQRLEACGVISREISSEDARAVIYRPTPAGKALLPVLVEMAYWGATHDAATDAPKSFVKAYRADRTRRLKSIESSGDPRQPPRT